MLTSRQEAIFALWKDLAGFSAAQCDAALQHLMRSLCDLLGAHDVVWVGAARVARGRTARRDPLRGWRGLAVRHHTHCPDILARSVVATKSQDTSPSPTTLALVSESGSLRVHRLHDGFVNMNAMRKTASYKVVYGDSGLIDRMYAGIPVNADAESYILIDRYSGKRFTADDADCVEFLMRGLPWFHRELLLAHGLLLAGAPLSPTERRIVHLLLTERSEGEIAAVMRQSPKTTHKYITEILRRYGVNSRAGLMALWLRRGD